MGKPTGRSFHRLVAFVFLLYFSKVSSDSILDAMKSDNELCEIPKFLYSNNITSICANETYPKMNVTADPKYRNTLLCLTLYDTWYKLNKSSPLCENKNFADADTFDLHIRKFFPKKGDDGESTFCKSIKDVTFSYKKLKPLLSILHVNTLPICYLLCFDLKAEFNPLCGILAWSKSIDIDMNKLSSNPQSELQSNKPLENDQINKVKYLNQNSNSTVKSEKKNTTETITENNKNFDTLSSNKKVAINLTKSNSPSESLKLNPIDSEKHKNVNTEDNNAMDQQKVNKPVYSKNINENSQNTHEKSENRNQKSQIKSEVAENQKNDSKKLTNTNEEPENTHKEPQITHNEPQIEHLNDINTNDQVAETAKDNDNIKTDVMPQGTQDNSVIQEDWNHSDDGKLLDDTNDPNEPDQHTDTDSNDLNGPNQPNDLGDQTQNIPKPPEQKDVISHYHSMRTDEESHIFTYFTVVSLISIVAYIGYYNKQKILAIVLEGRRSRNSRGRRRPSTANYRKLDCTLEEAVTSQCNANVTHVIY